MEINEYQKLAMRTLNPEIEKKELILKEVKLFSLAFLSCPPK